MTRPPLAMAAARPAPRTGRRHPRFGAKGQAAAAAAGFIVLALLEAFAAAGCRPSRHEESVKASAPRPLSEVLAAHTPELMKIPGVVGTAESQLEDGRPCILILVVRLTPALRARLPRQLEGWPVRVEESGEIHALPDSAR